MINPLLNPAYSLPPLGAAVVVLILLVVVLRKGGKTRGKWIFSGLLISMVLWNLLIFGMRSNPNIEQALIWIRISTVPGFAIFALFYHFILTFTNTKGQKYVLITAYTILVAFAALTPTGLVINDLRVENYGYAPIQGPVTFILSPLGFVFLGFTAYNLVRRYRQSPSNMERNRILYLLTAILFPLLGSLLDSFTNLPPAYVWGNLIFCLVCTVAILRYHLLDIHIALRRGLVYLIMSAIVAIPYVGTILLFSRLFEQAVPFWAHFIFLLLLALALQPLWQRVQRLVDKCFYRERYDFLKELQNFSQETHDISDLNELISSLVKLISRALQSASVYLLLTSASGDFVTVSSARESAAQLTIESGSPLLRWLRFNKGILRRQGLDTIPQLQSLTAKETSELEKIRAKLFVPLKTKEKELVGVLILSEKLSEQSYSTEDERVVLTVVSRMAIELENARLYALEKIMRKELQRQDEQKTEFLHSVGHELKTPLTAIISSSELLSEDSSTSHKLRERLTANIRTSANSMNRRVTELLDLAQMQIGRLKIESEPLEMNHAITEVASQLRILFEKKEQALTLEIPDSLSRVNADKGKLEQVLFNLLSNANKFSPTGSDITLRAREVDRRIIVEVEDSAPAVTEGEKMRLFDAYYRGEDVGKRERFSGLGLGLTISKKIVELHQGEIWVESNPVKGNTFAFSLPVLDRRTNGIK